MPVIKIKHIVSCSSEDSGHKAANLLGNDTTKKWKCLAGEKQATIVLQFEKSVLISSLDIGNEGSAFIEVLVGRSCSENVQYQVLLNASSFMTLQQSRQGTCPNKVRMFNRDALAPTIISEKWDLVKVVCTQPFNKRSSYGLSFIKFHTTEEETDAKHASSEPKVEEKVKGHRTTFGNFKLKTENESSSSQSYQPGSTLLLYNQIKKEEKDSSDTTKGPSTNKAKENELKRAKSQEESDRIEEKRRKTETSASQCKSTPVKFSNLKQQKQSNNKANPANDGKIKSQSKTSTIKSTHSQDPSRNSKPVRIRDKPYNQIMRGVIFVLSGFQNPLRGELREKGLGMGAQYRKDWTPDATHLVCAFPNTPKFRQVQGCRGKIVRKDWILECSSQKKLLSWRKYSMNPKQSSGSSSESEEEEKIPVVAKTSSVTARSDAKTSSLPVKEKDAAKEPDDDPYGGSTEGEDEDPYGGSTDDEGADTEEEIERIRKSENGEGDKEKDVEEDIYNASTDEEEKSGEDEDLPYLPDFLSGMTFMLYGDFSDHMRKQVQRHIVASGGTISQYMSDQVDYVITEQSWDRNFDAAVANNTKLVFVRPAWLFNCSTSQKLIPFQPYIVSSI